ncbi:MAG: DNA internalization-related competence protein ComEC/Rec2 [Bacteroidota bacterium]
MSSPRYTFGRYPAVRIVLFLIAGILLAGWIGSPIRIAVWVCIGVTAAYALLEGVQSRKISRNRTVVSSFFYLLWITSIGFLLMTLSLKSDDQRSLSEQIIHVSPWESVEMKGTITSSFYNQQGIPRSDLDVEYVKIGNMEVEGDGFKSRILLEEAFQTGEFIHFSGTVIPISEPRNPGAFNYKKYLREKGIHTQIRLDSLIRKSSGAGTFSWLRLRSNALSRIDELFSRENRAIAKALLLGYKSELEADQKQAFSRAGLSHIMAVSGLHVGFVVAPFWILIPYFQTYRYGKWTGLTLLILILWFYAGITGFSASVMRASLMAVFLAYGRLFHKPSNSINITASAGIVLLLIDPGQLFEVGFQLSFSAVFIILLLLPVLQHRLPYWVRVKWYGQPITVMLVSLVVQLGLLPIQAYYFGELSLISPLANALFVPWLGLIIPISLAAVVLSGLFLPVAELMNMPCEWFLHGLNTFVSESSGWTFSWMAIPEISFLLFPFWVALIMLISNYRFKRARWRWVIISLLLFCSLQLQYIIKKLESAPLQVTFFDVGQGDAALVSTPEGKHVLIDTGVWRPGSSSAESVLMPYFKANQISHLDAIILSHPHSDHIGGTAGLIGSLSIGNIYNSGFKYDSELYRSYLRRANEKEIPVHKASAGDQLYIDDSVLFLVMGPDSHPFGDDPNEHSVVLYVRYGDSEMLFTGDAGREQEQRLIHNYGKLLDIDVLKVGHHGSSTSSGISFLEEVTPEMAVLSLGERNRYRHPHLQALANIHRFTSNIWITARDKGLILRSDGKTIEVVLWH